jgi:hypothetical protein
VSSSAQRINQDSGDFEYYTPANIVEAARKTMGVIDLDPASSFEANKRVRALCFFSQDDDGLSNHWYGRVWMNHPFSRAGNASWINKLICEYSAGRVSAACCITYAATSEKWFQPLLAFPQCFLSPRTNYYLPDGSLKRGVTKGSVVTYLGTRVNSFAREFEALGSIKIECR